MRYMDNAQLDALTEQIKASSRMRDAALRSWAREALVEFCQTANIDPKLIEDEGVSASLNIPLDDQTKITLYVSGYNYPDVGASVGIEPNSSGSVFSEGGISAGILELARRLSNEAKYARNKAAEQDRVLAQVNAFIAKAYFHAATPDEDDGA